MLLCKKGLTTNNHSKAKRWLIGPCLIVTLIASFTTTSDIAHAKDLRFLIQPIQSPEHTKKFYRPLAEYLSHATGMTVKIIAVSNFQAYWEIMKRAKDYDLIMDAAHFTDYRLKHLGFSLLAKVPDVVSYTVVTDEKNFVLEPRELIGKTIATMSSPSLGGIRLAELFPNPMRQPIIIETSNSEEAIKKVHAGTAVAAIVPTPLLNNLSGLNTVFITEQVPHVAVSASPSVNEPMRDAIKKALLNANKTSEGKEMLNAIQFAGFENANEKLYDGYAHLLESVWGY